MDAVLRSVLRRPIRSPMIPAAGYLAESEALFARMSVTPTDDQAYVYDRLMVILKANGFLDLLDAFYFTAAHDEQAATLNWIADAYNLTASDPAPAFAAFRGFTPDGSATYLDTGFDPTTASSPKFTLDSAHLAAWHLTDIPNGAGTSFDVGNLTSRITNSPTGVTTFRVNNSTNGTLTEDYATAKVWNRSAADAWQYYRSGALVTSGVAASTALTAFSFGIGRTAASGAFGVNQVACVHFGASLTAAQVGIMYSAVRAALTILGAI